MSAGETRFSVRLAPRSGADEVEGVVDGVLRVRVTAAPVKDAANRALLRLVARELDVAITAVRIVGGAHGRRKTLVVEGLDATRVAARWPGLHVWR